jgi:hypothetical protein
MALTDEPLSMDSAAIGGAADIGRLAAGQDSRTRWRDGLAARGAGTGAEWSRRIGVLMSTAMDDPEGRVGHICAARYVAISINLPGTTTIFPRIIV